MNGKSILKGTLKGFGITAGVLAGLLTVFQIVLSTGLATNLVNKFAADYVDGTLSFGKVSVNVFNRFPAVSVSLEDAFLTYPHDRFEKEEQSQKAYLLRRGRGEVEDTLASFRELTVAVNVIPYVASGKIDIKKAILDRPRAFAKYYQTGKANWDMFRLGGSDEEDTTSTPLPPIRVRKVELTGHPDIVFCDLQDTLFANLRLKEMMLNGNIDTENIAGSEGRFHIDSLFVAGRLKRDTVLFALDYLTLKEHDRKADLKASADAYLRTGSYGRLKVPFRLDAEASFPEDSVLAVRLDNLDAIVAGIPFKAIGDVRFLSDKTYICGEAAVDRCRLNNVLRNYVDGIVEQAREVSTDATLTVTAMVDGFFSSDLGLMPDLLAEVIIPESKVSHSGYGVDGKIALKVEAEAEAGQPVNVYVRKLIAEIPGLAVDGEGKALDLLGRDPVFDVDVDAVAELDSLMRFIPADKGYHASGELEACLIGKIRQSQLNMEKAARANLTGLLVSDVISFSSDSDTLSAELNSLNIELAACGNKIDDSVEKGARMLALLFDIDSLSANYKNSLTAYADKFHLKAQNSADILDSKKKSSFYPFCGELSVGKVFMRDSDSLVVVLRDSKNEFRISPKKENASVPVLKLTSSNGGLFLKSYSNRVAAKDFGVNATAVMTSLERRLRMKPLVDSLAKVYPDIPRDSVLRYHFGRKMASETPDWMKDEDLKKGDINISLSESMKKYFRDWDLSGQLNLGRAMLSTPYFPLKNSVENMRGRFTNDRIDLDSFVLKSGQSDISATGAVYGLRRAVLGNGIINLDLNITSDVLQVNELLGAYDAGRKVDEDDLARLSQMDDDAYQKACVQDVADAQVENTLLVVPGNVKANINLEANRISYSTLEIDWMEAELAMKERCVQISNTVATSNMGDIYFEGFYSTKTKKNVKTGFFLNLVDITAEKVIELVPQVDTIIPMLKSFSGLLDCTLAATAGLDENMNVIMPSVNGVTRITGKNLEIYDDKDISKIAKILMFRNKKTIHVDKMSVEGLLENSKLEVFPFMLNVDRYKVALSGIQNLDMSFRYHVSVIKSPIWFKFGVDLFGDFDKWKFKLGKAKYRSAKKVPVFTKVIDQTTINLTNSIHTIFEKGVDAAVAENEAQKAIQEFKESTNYVAVVDQPLDTLSGRDAARMSKLEKMEEGVEALGLDLDELTAADLETLDPEVVAKLKDLGVTKEFLEKRDAEDEDSDEEDSEE